MTFLLRGHLAASTLSAARNHCDFGSLKCGSMPLLKVRFFFFASLKQFAQRDA
jgi:hypothetical protein